MRLNHHSSLFFSRGKGKRISAVLTLLLLTVWGCAAAAEVEITFLNVGKADAALIRCGDYSAMVDCGGKETLSRVISALSSREVSRLNAVFFSHSHDDHTGAFKKLSKTLPVEKFYHSVFSELTGKGKDFFENLSEKTGVPGETLRAGDVLTPAEGLSIEVLGPLEKNGDYNDQSLVLRLRYAGVSVLFCGDMQFTEEFSLLRSGADLSADVLKVGNHGNPDSGSEAFLKAVSPRAAVISTDTKEDSDSANARIVNLLEELGCKVMVTEDYEGGVEIVISEDGSVSVRGS